MVQLVSAWSALPGVLGLPPQTQGLGPVEGRGGPDLLLPLAVDTLQHSLLGFKGLGLGLSLGRYSFLLRPSAKTAMNVNEIFMAIAKKLPKSEPQGGAGSAGRARGGVDLQETAPQGRSGQCCGGGN